MTRKVYENLYNETPEEAAVRIINNNNVKTTFDGIRLCTITDGNKLFPVVIGYTGRHFEGDPEIEIVFTF